MGQLFSSSLAVYQPCRQLALAAAFILLSLLVSAGDFINLAKSSPLPSTSVRFLGFISDSILQAFLVPLDKKDKFKALRQELLGSSSAPVKACSASRGRLCRLALQFRPVSSTYERLSKLKILSLLFQYGDLYGKSFRNGLFWTTGLVTCPGDRSIISLLRYSPTPLRGPGEQFWLGMVLANKSVIIGWIMNVTSMSLRLERFTTL